MAKPGDRVALDRGTEEDLHHPPDTEPTEAPVVVYHVDAPHRFDAFLEEDTAIFDSRFETGNLRAAVRHRNYGGPKDQVYELTLQDDAVEPGSVRWWFCFSVSNVQPGIPYEFRIVNVKRHDKMFTSAMHPVMFSCAEAASSGQGWTRCGHNVQYHPTPMEPSEKIEALEHDTVPTSGMDDVTSGWRKVRRFLHRRAELSGLWVPQGKVGFKPPVTDTIVHDGPLPALDSALGPRGPLTFRFTVEFKHEHDTVFFAPTFPYGYSTTSRFLDAAFGVPRHVHDSVKAHKTAHHWADVFAGLESVDDAADAGSGAGGGAAESKAGEEVEDPAERLREFEEIEDGGMAPPLALPVPVSIMCYPRPDARFPEDRAYRTVLCRSVEGFPVEFVTITTPSAKPKPVIAFLARQHPGESSSSIVAEGVMNFLASDDPVAARLRDHFEFQVFPCMNPDGVANGSYTRSLAGGDLNHAWLSPNAAQQPEVYHVKNHLRDIQRHGGRLLSVLDLHSHSAKSGVFMYGVKGDRAKFDRRNCVHFGFPEDTWRDVCGCGEWLGPDTDKYGQDPREFAACLDKNVEDFESASAKYDVFHPGSARATMWYELRVPLPVTLETSVVGGSDHPFSTADYREVGAGSCRALADYFFDADGKPVASRYKPNLEREDRSHHHHCEVGK